MRVNMEQFPISKTDAGLHIEGFPDALKVIRLDGPLAQRLSDLALHKSDLEFSDACLEGLNAVPEEANVLRQALWQSAIIHFSKCFGNSGARFQLNARKIYKSEPPEAMVAFAYFQDLRDKHVAHDENSYAQSLPGAVLNRGDKEYKIEKVICFNAIANTLEQANFSNLKLLIGKAHTWVISEFDQLCDTLAKQLEQELYETLLVKEALNYRVPTVDEISKNRKKKK